MRFPSSWGKEKEEEEEEEGGGRKTIYCTAEGRRTSFTAATKFPPPLAPYPSLCPFCVGSVCAASAQLARMEKKVEEVGC